METTSERMLRLSIEKRQHYQDKIKKKATFEHRRTYTIGQMVIDSLDDIPDYVQKPDGTKVIYLSRFEKCVKTLSEKATIHRLLSSASPITNFDVNSLANELCELFKNSTTNTKSVNTRIGVVPEEDRVSKYTDKCHILKRRRYLVGKIMLHYFHEFPPLTDETNEEYRKKLDRFKEVLSLINYCAKMISSDAIWINSEKENLQ